MVRVASSKIVNRWRRMFIRAYAEMLERELRDKKEEKRG